MNQKELAEILGISQATVSLALAGDPRVSAATRKKVLEAADKMGYVPNANARALVRKRTETVGVVVLGLSKDNMRAELFFSDAILAIAMELGKEGYNILLKVAELTGKKEFLTGLAQEKRVDGLIILTLAPFYKHFVTGLDAIDFPFVLVNRHLGTHPVNCVVLDDFGATFQAVESKQLGHRRTSRPGTTGAAPWPTGPTVSGQRSVISAWPEKKTRSSPLPAVRKINSSVTFTGTGRPPG